jgi:hypothetical protein
MVQLGALAREAAAIEAVQLIAHGLLNRTAAIRELLFPDGAIESLQQLGVDCDGDLGGRHVGLRRPCAS